MWEQIITYIDSILHSYYFQLILQELVLTFPLQREGEVLLPSVGVPDQRSSVTSSFLHGSRKDHLHALCQTRQPTPHSLGFTEGKQLSKTLEILAFRWYN